MCGYVKRSGEKMLKIFGSSGEKVYLCTRKNNVIGS